jgi:hypothetical protein
MIESVTGEISRIVDIRYCIASVVLTFRSRYSIPVIVFAAAKSSWMGGAAYATLAPLEPKFKSNMASNRKIRVPLVNDCENRK